MRDLDYIVEIKKNRHTTGNGNNNKVKVVADVEL